MKRLGLILVIIGVLIFGFYFIRNKSVEKKSQNDMNDYINQTSKIVKEKQKEPITVPQEKKRETTININYTAVIEIPKISLKSGVVNSTKNFKSINYAISVDNSSHYPDEKGNFILYSHSGNSSIAFFNKLYKLTKGDNIYVYYNGIKYYYEVIKKYDIKKTGKAKVINSKSDKIITLITCDLRKNGYQIVVEGKIVGEENY